MKERDGEEYTSTGRGMYQKRGGWFRQNWYMVEPGQGEGEVQGDKGEGRAENEFF